jgi:SPOR domain
MKSSIVVVLALCFLCLDVVAQQRTSVQINEDPRVSNLIIAWTQANRANSKVSGWRVQILSTNDRAKADAMRQQFKTQYPDLAADWTHERPYYKVRVGAFRTRSEALGFAAELRNNYPGCFPALDTAIHPRDFLRSSN